ncbi:MAG: DUF3488 and transglutaminase-like domain-containing protein [Polyangiaceae bacterium]
MSDAASARALRALPIVVAAVTLALSGTSALAPIAVIAAAIVAVWVGPRLPLDRPTLRLASLVIVILVIAGVRAAGISVHAFAFGAALAPLIVAVLRLVVTDAEWGYVFTSLLSFVAMLACGASRMGALYGALVVASLASILLALRAEDPNRVPAARVPRRAVYVGAGIVGAACLFATGAALVLRPLQAYAQRRITQSFQDAMLGRVMFSDSMHLGKMTPLFKSNRVVMRIRGKQVDWLRGAVLDRYDGRRWLREGGGDAKVEPAPRGPLVGDDVTTFEKVGDDGDRWFLPLGLAALATPSGAVKVDGHGVARVFKDDERIVWMKAGPRAVLPVDGVARVDLQVPSEDRRPLALLASHWAREESTPEGALLAIARHLRAEYKYTLAAARNERHDPVLDFLFENKEGHCEYFASAMALLARSVGIPARVVTGYRVGEKNPILGHYVVRERNAHAWVEAYLEGRGWVLFDPTPNVELAQNEPHDEEGVAALTELFLAGVGRVEAWLAERTVGELSVAAAIGLVVFGLVRYFGQKPAPTLVTASPALAFSPPLAAFVALEAALEKRGTGRRPEEPLEAFAARTPAPFADLVARYARVRYGGAEDARLEDDLRAAVRGEERESAS